MNGPEAKANIELMAHCWLKSSWRSVAQPGERTSLGGLQAQKEKALDLKLDFLLQVSRFWLLVAV
jgi:hypothetical protein